MVQGFALCEIYYAGVATSPSLGFRVIEANQAFAAFTNSTTERFVGKDLSELIPELAAACRFTFVGSIESIEPQTFRIHQTNPLGEFEASVYPLTPHYVAILLLDVPASLKKQPGASAKLETEGEGNRGVSRWRFEQPGAPDLGTAAKLLEDKQHELLLYKKDLELVNRELVQANDAISVLARRIDRKRDELEKKIARSVSSQILPLIEELQQDHIHERTRVKLDVVSAHLRSLVPRISRERDIIISLSPMELKVAMMIKKGFSTDEIARMLHLSGHTVKTHRRSIRRKLNIRNSKINQTSYLRFKLDKPESPV